MKILALEFSCHERSVAISTASGATLASVSERDFRGVTGMALIDRAFQQANFKRTEISALVVGLGPGSYTGIRSSIAIAQGWQLGRNVKVAGISSILCLAEEARVQGIHGQVTILVDAQRTEVYLARYEINETQTREIEPLQIVPVSSLFPDGVIIGPEASRFVAGARDLVPRAETLARLSATGGNFTSAENLEPIYLRQITFVKAGASAHWMSDRAREKRE